MLVNADSDKLEEQLESRPDQHRALFPWEWASHRMWMGALYWPMLAGFFWRTLFFFVSGTHACFLVFVLVNIIVFQKYGMQPNHVHVCTLKAVAIQRTPLYMSSLLSHVSPNLKFTCHQLSNSQVMQVNHRCEQVADAL